MMRCACAGPCNHMRWRCNRTAFTCAVKRCLILASLFACVCVGAEVPMPYAANLEAAALPQIDDIVKQVKKCLGK